MSQPTVHAPWTATVDGDSTVRRSPISSPNDDLNQQIIRFDLLVEVVCDEQTELARFLNAHTLGQPDIDHVEIMTRIGRFKNQFLLKRHVT